jgi:hypothetical protein
MPLRIERKDGIRKKVSAMTCPSPGGNSQGRPPRRLDAGADEPAGGGNEREGKTRDTQRRQS